MSLSDRDMQLAQSICREYIDVYPQNKIWVTKRFGKRDSYLAGLGEEKFCEALRVKLSEDYTAFVEEDWDMSELRKIENEELLKKLFDQYS